MKNNISVYDYTDYRRFLKESFSAQKLKNSSFSFRSFNRIAGIKSSGFLKLVMDGQRNLADDGIRKIAKGFKLKEAERDYFELLVKFNQAEDHEEKDRYFRQLSQNKKFLAAKPLTGPQYRLFSHWYYVAILEIIRIDTKAKKDVKWVQSQLNPPVGIKAVKTAIKELMQLKLVGERKNGNLFRRQTMLTTEDEVQSLSVANFHSQMCEIANRSVLKEPAPDREFSSLTIATSEKSFKRAKEEIQRFRKKLHSILEQETGQTKSVVGHINFQLFKLNKSEKTS